MCGIGVDCPKSERISITVSEVRNPRSTKSIPNEFRLRTHTKEGYDIDQGTMQAADASDLEIEPAFFTDVSLIEPDAGSEIVTGQLAHSYLIRIQLNNGLLADRGRLTVSFPEQVMIIPHTEACLAYDELNAVLLDCRVSPDTMPQKVIITHSNQG